MAAKSSRIDDVSSTLTYVGEAPVGAADTDEVWRISRIQIIGTETIIKYADGSTGWNHKWTDRASLTYT